ncbi:lysine-rich arabinogalactan protein 19-like [Punica granatum]|uniref:Lysine-rich arabinogalactan protein 19-like n=1 Tax=Punica granatum TaxID=22663 RepID=A0A6P8E872_PUNGR|nr:lysine-rich arabinogalactan protein 19-like [Punica granatum]
MANFCFFALIALLSVHLALSADPPQISPSPAPEFAADSTTTISPSKPAPANAPHSPISSPPSPPPSDAAPVSSPSTSPSPPSQSPSKHSAPSPSPASPSDVNHSNVISDADTDSGGSSGGMSAGKKLGITVAVIVGAGLVVLGGLIYKRRQDNIRRSQYSYAARREIL